MKNKKTKRARFPSAAVGLVFLVLVFLFFRGSAKVAVGGAGDNVRGYAWSSNFGWISMNCLDNASCGASDYGVKIYPASGGNAFNFDGYAWSAGAGWISFHYNAGDPVPPDNYKFNASCANSNCIAGNSCLACFNPDDGKIYGWAKVLSFGNDGWISLGTTTAAIPYRVSIDQTSASGSFEGWGWNGNTEKYKGLGWVSFNCNNPEVNSCGSSDYFVYLASSHLPSAVNLSSPNYNYANACPAPGVQSGVALNSFLRWQFSDPDQGSSQTAFRVIVNTANSTTTPAPLIDTGKKKLAVNQYNASNTYGILSYDTLYYWWVKVWDDFGFVSPWKQFDTGNGGTLTDNNARNVSKPGNSKTFITYRHEFPEAKFYWIPSEPLAYYPVTSTLAGFYYDSSNNRLACADNEANCSSTWTGVNNLTNSATTSSSTVMTFRYGNGAKINLTLENIGGPADDNYVCTSSTPPFFVDLLPVWKEKKAQ